MLLAAHCSIKLHQNHRRIAGGAWGCCSTPKLSEIFRLSEILGCLSEIFITHLYKKRTLYYCENVFIIFP